MSHTALNSMATPYLPDPYLPKSGSPGYRVHHYDLELDCRLASNRLVGRARIDAVADAALTRIELDLCGLAARKVQVDGKKAARFTQRADKLLITPAAPLAAGRGFQLDIRYDGTPRPRVGHFGEVGWEELTDGVLVANQPDGAATWFPCNDHPSQKATYRISVATDAGYRAVCNGKLVGHNYRSSREEWVYQVGEPMATYLATVQIGRYGMSAVATGVGAGGPPAGAGRHRPEGTTVSQWLATGPAQEAAAMRALEEQPRMLEVFADAFGAYPFADYGVVVTNDDLEIPLEAHGLSILGRNHLAPGWEHQRLIAHELAHQWFGNSLTVGSWDEIWLHEGFACYAEWIWSEASGADSAHEQARAAWTMLARLPQDITVGAPGAANMFDDRVYKRGALALHVLRLHVGEGVFFSILRAWTQAMGHGTVTYALFCEHVDAHFPAGFSTRGLLAPWLFQDALPAFPASPKMPAA